MDADQVSRTPGFKFGLAILVGLLLTIPLFSIWLLVYDRQSQAREATQSITAGWGGPQAISGPVLVIPYRVTETVVQNGQSVTRSNPVMRELTLAPEASRSGSNPAAEATAAAASSPRSMQPAYQSSRSQWTSLTNSGAMRR